MVGIRLFMTTMSSRRRITLWRIIGCLFAVSAGVVSIWLFQEVEYFRFKSPDNQHIAIVTWRRYESWMPAFPGQGSDRPGFVRIEEAGGVNYGRIAIPMVWMARDLEWTRHGAELKMVCQWDFLKQEIRYWNDAQTEEIVGRAEPAS